MRIRRRSPPALVALAALACATPPAQAVTADSLTVVLPVEFHAVPVAPCDGDTVRIVAVNACSPCFSIRSFEPAGEGLFRLTLSRLPSRTCATLPCGGEERTHSLGRLAAGSHTVALEIVARVPDGPAGATREIVRRRTLTLLVRRDCGGAGAGPKLSHARVGPGFHPDGSQAGALRPRSQGRAP